MSTRPHPIRGYIYIASATLLWGISASLGRAAFTGRLLPAGGSDGTIDPLILSQFRTTFSGLVLLPVLLVARGPAKLRLRGIEVGRLLLLGVVGLAASNYFYYLAIQRTNVATAIILQYTAPVWVLIYMLTRGFQRPSLQRTAAVALAMAGIAITIGVGSEKLQVSTVGVIAGLLTAFSFAFYNIAAHDLLVRRDHWIVLLYTTVSATLFWAVINPPWKIATAHYSVFQWFFLFGFAMLSMLGPFAFYFAGLKYLEPTRAIIVSCLEPVFTVLIAAGTLGEPLGVRQALGICLIVVAIIAIQKDDRSFGQRSVLGSGD